MCGFIDCFQFTANLVSYDHLNAVSVSENHVFASEIKAYPNPCSEATEISYSLKSPASVEFQVISMDGKIIYTLSQKGLSQGSQTQRFLTQKWGKGSFIVVLRSFSDKAVETSTVRLVVK